MSEPFVGNEMSEELEGTEALNRATQELNEITNEPESYIETKIDVPQSEVIESSFNQLVNNRISGGEVEIPALDGSSKLRYDLAGGVEADEVDKVSPEGEKDISEVSSLPIPMPKPPDVGEAELSMVEPAENLAEVLPLTVPLEGPGGTSSTGEDGGLLPILNQRVADAEGTSAVIVEFNVAGEIAATFNGTTVSLIGENG